jgi:ParG
VRKISKAKEPGLKRMNLNVPVELHNSFNAATASQGLNMTDVLMAYIKEYVEKHSSPKQKGRRK